MLFVFFFSLMFISCTDDTVTNQPNESEKIIIKLRDRIMGGGDERMYEFAETVFDSTNIQRLTYGDVETHIIKDTTVHSDTIALNRWNMLKSTIDFNEIMKADTIVLPYDTSSFMQAWLTVKVGKKSKTIRFNYVNPVTEKFTVLPSAYQKIYEFVSGINAEKFHVN